MATPTFPDLAIRVDARTPDDPLGFTLSTFNPDADDDGRPRDYGVTVIEGGEIVGDGTRDGWDTAKIRQLLSLLEHAPDLHTLLTWLVTGAYHGQPLTEDLRARLTDRARRLLADIAAGELKYADRF